LGGTGLHHVLKRAWVLQRSRDVDSETGIEEALHQKSAKPNAELIGK
jgi:hypothetical protein